MLRPYDVATKERLLSPTLPSEPFNDLAVNDMVQYLAATQPASGFIAVSSGLADASPPQSTIKVIADNPHATILLPLHLAEKKHQVLAVMERSHGYVLIHNSVQPHAEADTEGSCRNPFGPVPWRTW